MAKPGSKGYGKSVHLSDQLRHKAPRNRVLVAQTVTQASWGVMKEDRMDVEQCYRLFSAELESEEALASSQQKFQTLNLADYKVEAITANGACLPPRVAGEV